MLVRPESEVNDGAPPKKSGVLQSHWIDCTGPDGVQRDEGTKRVNTLRLVALGCLLGGVLGTGCSKKVNSDTANLLTTVRVSLASTGAEGNAEVLNPTSAPAVENEKAATSDDGRFTVFTSKASNLVATDTNGNADVFRRDNVTRTTVLVSVNAAGTDSGNGTSTQPAISGDGNLVVFQSTATNLTADILVGTGPSHVYFRDMTTGVTTLVSRASGGAGAIGNGNSNNAQISTTGRFIVWDTTSTNFDIVNDTDAGRDVYRRDLGSAGLDTILISRRSGVAGVRGNGDSIRATISADGRFVCFQSMATNLPVTTLEGAPDTNVSSDIYVRDTATGATTRVSVSKVGDPQEPNPNGASENAMISGNGNFVVFRSLGSNLVAEDDGTASDIFVRNLTSSTTEIQSVHSSGAQAGQACNFPRISADGTIVVWDSLSPNLVNGDANNVNDIFVRNRATFLTSRISVSTFGGELNGNSRRPNLSGDGRYVVFYTEASNAADDDTNGTGDIYMRGPPF